MPKIKPFGKVYQYPTDPSSFQSIIEEHQTVDLNSNEKMIDAQISPASIGTAFGRYWSRCKINSIDLVYYPYYIIVYEKIDGTKRHEIIDGITGNRQEYLEGVISPSIIE